MGTEKQPSKKKPAAKERRGWVPPAEAEFLRRCLTDMRKQVAEHYHVDPGVIAGYVQWKYRVGFKDLKLVLQFRFMKAKLEKDPEAVLRWLMAIPTTRRQSRKAGPRSQTRK